MVHNLRSRFFRNPRHIPQGMTGNGDQWYMDAQGRAECPATLTNRDGGLGRVGGGDGRPVVRRLKLGVVVPCRGDGEHLEKCLQSLGPELEAADQVVVVNCLKDLYTQRVAQRFAARAVNPPGPSRGAAVAAGVAAMDISGETGRWRLPRRWDEPGDAEPVDWLLIVHADLAFPRGWRARLEHAVQMNPEAQWGAFGHIIADHRMRFRLMEAGNAWRAAWWEIPYGDQAMFVKTGALARIGGFPMQEKYEDLELSLRLKAIGPPLYLDYPVVTGSRHWQHGTAGRTFRNWCILAAYRFGWLSGGQLKIPASTMETCAGGKAIEA